MAPETFVNVKVELDQQTDVWALGVILMWMVTALELGSLQHPSLDREEGEEFDVKWIALYLGCNFLCGGMVDFQKKKQFKLEKWDEDEDHGGLRHNLLPFFLSVHLNFGCFF